MALSNAERQRKWLEKNRAAFNLRRRNARKKLNPEYAQAEHDDLPQLHPPDQRSTMEALRKLVATVPKEVPPEPVRPVVFRNDYGAIITEGQWNRLQELKRKAHEGGYERDEFSQG